MRLLSRRDVVAEDVAGGIGIQRDFPCRDDCDADQPGKFCIRFFVDLSYSARPQRDCRDRRWHPDTDVDNHGTLCGP